MPIEGLMTANNQGEDEKLPPLEEVTEQQEFKDRFQSSWEIYVGDQKFEWKERNGDEPPATIMNAITQAMRQEEKRLEDMARERKEAQERKPPDIQYNPLTQAIYGDFKPELAIRVLREYLDPINTVVREQYRKKNRWQYWEDLTVMERLAMTIWGTCCQCGENTWCLVRNRMTNVVMEPHCEHCFYLQHL